MALGTSNEHGKSRALNAVTVQNRDACPTAAPKQTRSRFAEDKGRGGMARYLVVLVTFASFKTHMGGVLLLVQR
jgi:hypothetical protein